MKSKFAKFGALLMGGLLALSLCACGGGGDEKPDHQDPPVSGEEDGKQDPPVSGDTTPTSSDVATAIQKTLGATVQNYDFTLNLAGSVTVGAFTTPDANANYVCNYRYNAETDDLQFKRVTSGALLYDSTEYIYSSGDSRVTVKMDDKGTVKKAAVEYADEELHLINLPFVTLVKSLSAKEIGSIKKTSGGYKATLSLSSENKALNALCSFLGKMDTSINLKGVEFSNPATGLGFEFALSGETLSSFTLTADVSVPIGPATTDLSLTYTQKTNSSAVKLPDVSGIILGQDAIATELATVNSALAAVKEMDVYSLDVEAVNEMDPGWNVKAIKDSYLSRLYKHTDEEGFTHFNNSFVFKTHHEEDGKETYKYTIGNVTEDGKVYLVDRKGLNTTSQSAETVTSRFDFLTSIFGLNASQTDCIKKTTANGETTYAIYLKNSAIAALSDDIVNLINTCPAEGVTFVDNLMGTDYTIEDAALNVVIKDGKLVSMKLETEIKYNPTSGEYAEYNVTLNNSLSLLVNDEENFAKAAEYTAPKKDKTTLGIGDDLAGSKYYIL